MGVMCEPMRMQYSVRGTCRSARLLVIYYSMVRLRQLHGQYDNIT
jgi:hypothetical protein